jgi:hypothetical protein
MTMRTTSKIVTFRGTFHLNGIDRSLPPGEYRVATDEERLEELSFIAYRRVATSIFVPAPSGSAIEMVIIDPLELEAALDHDATLDVVHR